MKYPDNVSVIFTEPITEATTVTISDTIKVKEGDIVKLSGLDIPNYTTYEVLNVDELLNGQFSLELQAIKTGEVAR